MFLRRDSVKGPRPVSRRRRILKLLIKILSFE
jgi:hypothetical protein